MSIEKMVLLKIVGSTEEMNSIIKELILNKNVHFNMNIENSSAYTDYYVIHKFETDILGSEIYNTIVNPNDNRCTNCLNIVKNLAAGLGVELKIDQNILKENYDIAKITSELKILDSSAGNKIREINKYNTNINELKKLREKLDSIFDKSLELDKISDLNYFNFAVGTLSKMNKWRLKKNYENLSAIVMRIGSMPAAAEDLYMIIFPKHYRQETENLLKSLDWNELKIPDEFMGTPAQMLLIIDDRIKTMESEIQTLSLSMEAEKESKMNNINRYYNIFNLEEQISALTRDAEYGDNIFAVNVWVENSELNNVKDSIYKVTDKIILSVKSAEELKSQVIPPTMLKNNWLIRPFEWIVKMYGMPSYNELDPTPFLAVTFCLAFGIMFGDIGQGLIYFLFGLLFRKKIGSLAEIVMRLGLFSIVFGFVYGSFFGLEKHELSWLPSLIEGGPLNPDNIPNILIAGIVYGIFALTVSYVYGIVNSLKNQNIEEGIFGKNGIFGYLFFISFIVTITAITRIINIPLYIPFSILILSLIIIIVKEPLTNLVLGKKPLFHESPGSYFTESIFEAVETILGAMSNSISFVRVGAFALNHAGLFMAFLVISQMVENLFLKILIIVIGNILILSLEGIIVFIQGLRLQYYEMFSKYFKGDGIEYKPLILNKQ